MGQLAGRPGSEPPVCPQGGVSASGRTGAGGPTSEMGPSHTGTLVLGSAGLRSSVRVSSQGGGWTSSEQAIQRERCRNVSAFVDLTWGPIFCYTPSVTRASLVHCREGDGTDIITRPAVHWTEVCRLATHKKEGFSPLCSCVVIREETAPANAPGGTPWDPWAGLAPGRLPLVREARRAGVHWVSKCLP